MVRSKNVKVKVRSIREVPMDEHLPRRKAPTLSEATGGFG